MRLRIEEGTSQVQAFTFLLAAVTGAAFIVFLKMLEIRQLIVTLAPCMVMAAYASLVMGRYYRTRADQIGDNLYYLGFIFTLVSLSDSHAQFSGGGSAEEIVANFGIALATTLVGVTLRVVFNQMRSDPVETEKEARLQLAEASRRLKVELMNASAEFGMAARASRQSVNDAIDEMKDKFGSTLDAAGAKLSASISKSSDGMSGASKVLETQLGEAATRLSDASETLRTALGASQARWDEGLKVSSERNAEFNAAARKLSAAIDRLAKRLDEGVGPVDGVEQRFAALAAAAEILERRLSGARSQVDGGVDAIVALKREATEVSRVAAEASAAVQAQAASLDQAVAAVSRAELAAHKIEEQPDRINEVVANIEAQMQGVVDKALSVVDRMEASRAAEAAPIIVPPAAADRLHVEPYVPPVHDGDSHHAS